LGGTASRYFIACPACGEFQELEATSPIGSSLPG
jgi:hypothetical protein